MDKSLITFIIVTWNSQNEIDKCLRGIKKYTQVRYDVIVLDNNSKDNTVEIIRKNHADVKCVESNVNLGFAKANNKLLETVETPYVCFLNPDVIFIEDITESAIEILRDDDTIGIVGCKLLNTDYTFQPSCYLYSTPYNMFMEILHVGEFIPSLLINKLAPMYYKGNKPMAVNWLIGAEMIMRTKDAKAIHGFSTDYFMYTEDMDLCKKIDVILKKKVLYCPINSIIHIGGASEKQNVNYNKQRKLFENELIFNEKFYGKESAVKLIKYMIYAYIIRMFMLKLFYWKKNRNFIIEKTLMALKILKEIRKNKVCDKS